jgi:hypothetical protein
VFFLLSTAIASMRTCESSDAPVLAASDQRSEPLALHPDHRLTRSNAENEREGEAHAHQPI